MQLQCENSKVAETVKIHNKIFVIERVYSVFGKCKCCSVQLKIKCNFIERGSNVIGKFIKKVNYEEICNYKSVVFVL